MVSPPANSSEVSSQSTLPSFRAMKPSRLAAMWIVTRESVVARKDMQPLVSGQAFLLQELFQSQTHFGPNIPESHHPLYSEGPSNCCYCLVVSALPLERKRS